MNPALALSACLILLTVPAAAPNHVIVTRMAEPQAATLPLAAPVISGIGLNLSAFEATAYRDGRALSAYPIAIGTPSRPTPQGSFTIVSRLRRPTWYPTGGQPPVPPGPANPLGDWWLGLDLSGYGLHGTNAPGSIRTAASLGCVRLFNHDVSELAAAHDVGTPVVIANRPVEFRFETVNGRLWLYVYRDPYGSRPPGESELQTVFSQAGLELDRTQAAAMAADLLKQGPGADSPVIFELTVPGLVMGTPVTAWTDGGRVFAPIRELAAALGISVHYDPETATASAGGRSFCGPITGGVMSVPVFEFGSLFGLDRGTDNGLWRLDIPPPFTTARTRSPQGSLLRPRSL